MKTIFCVTITILFLLFLGSTISGQALHAFALEGSSMNSDRPPEDANDDDAKNPCPPSYIKLVSPRAAAVGATISIQGWRFGDSAGTVTFPEGVPAKITLWRQQRIEVIVPEGAQTGNITVISACGSENKKGAGSYFKVMEKAKAQ
jgi:hypothetical protein